MTTTHTNRESWLLAAIEVLRPMIAEAGATVPATIRVSVGFPKAGGRSTGKAIGQCWATGAAKDEVPNVFISPVLDDPARVLDVLAHELIHAADNCENGHRGPFARTAKALGLEGSMTATVAGEGLRAKLEAIAEDLGPYPHGAMVDPRPARGSVGSRLLKAECPECGYIARVSRKWLDEAGAPLCRGPIDDRHDIVEMDEC